MEDAQAANDALDNQAFGGRNLKVNLAREREGGGDGGDGGRWYKPESPQAPGEAEPPKLRRPALARAL
jgi:hypothetical protein